MSVPERHQEHQRIDRIDGPADDAETKVYFGLVRRPHFIEQTLQVQRAVAKADDRLAGDRTGMAEQAIIDDTLAEQPTRNMQPHWQPVIFVRRFMKPVAFAEGRV